MLQRYINILNPKGRTKIKMMRVITGSAKGVRLDTLPGNNTRPTSERAKEAIFSSLQFSIEGRDILDLYAGSGQLGIEALSRGAKSAVFIDSERLAVDIIKKNLIKTRLSDRATVFCSDVFSAIDRIRQGFDIVFIDPPYVLRAVPTVLKTLVEHKLLKPSTIVVCESEEEDIFSGNGGLREFFNVQKISKYAAAHVTVLGMNKDLFSRKEDVE